MTKIFKVAHDLCYNIVAGEESNYKNQVQSLYVSSAAQTTKMQIKRLKINDMDFKI